MAPAVVWGPTSHQPEVHIGTERWRWRERERERETGPERDRWLETEVEVSK